MSEAWLIQDGSGPCETSVLVCLQGTELLQTVSKSRAWDAHDSGCGSHGAVALYHCYEREGFAIENLSPDAIEAEIVLGYRRAA